MTVVGILMAVIGIPLALFVPGYILARISFRRLDHLEKIALGFIFSIVIDIIIGLFLGYNETMKNLTGGMTAPGVWVSLCIITIGLMILWIFQNKDESRRVWRMIIGK